MTKAELVAKLEVVKDHSPVVSIDKMIALIQQLEETKIVEFKMTNAMFDNIMETVENAVNSVSDFIVDKDGVEFELDYNNQILVTDVPVATDTIVDEIRRALDCEFEIVDEFKEEAELTCDPGCGCCTPS